MYDTVFNAGHTTAGYFGLENTVEKKKELRGSRSDKKYDKNEEKNTRKTVLTKITLLVHFRNASVPPPLPALNNINNIKVLSKISTGRKAEQQQDITIVGGGKHGSMLQKHSA